MSTHVAATTPYPWPYDGDLAGPGTALLVVAPAGVRAPDGEPVAAVGRLARAVHRVGGTVVVATTTVGGRRQRPPGGASTGGASAGDGVLRLLDGEPADHAVVAGGVDAFYASPLDRILRDVGVRRLLLAGVGLETGVHSTMRDANDRGYECLLVLDACVPVDPTLTAASVSMIEMSGGIFGAVGRAADVLAALAEPAVPAPTVTPPDLAPAQGDQR
ncbi:MAG TPA: isochorismatase family protein [Actinotalea sp.]|nr:isochorismatase family protein [Actinotalea sp.]